MKKIVAVLLIMVIVGVGLVAQESNENDPLGFEVSYVEADNAKIEFSYNELTGVLRVTYTLKDFVFSLGDADVAIRDEVQKFADEHGYFKYRLYPEEDDVRYFQETRTTRYKRFYILYDKNKLQ